MLDLNKDLSKKVLRPIYVLFFTLVLSGCSLINPPKVDSFLLSWPMLYLELHDLGQRTDMLVQSDFWSYVKKVDISPFVEDDQLASKLLNEYKTILSKVEEGLGTKGWRHLFGEELYLSLYSPGRVKKSPENVLSHAIIAGRMSLLAKGAAHLSSFWGEYIDQVAIDSDVYLGKKIYRIHKANALDLFFVLNGDYIYLSLDGNILKKCLDSKENNRLRLVDQKSHREYKKNLARNIWFSGYFDYTRYRLYSIKKFQSEIDDTSKNEEELLESQSFVQRLNNFTGIDNFVFTLSKDNDNYENVSLSITYDEDNLSDFLAHSLNKPNRKNRSYSFMPRDTKFYLWYTNMEADVWWSTYSMLSDQTKVDAFRNLVYDKFSLDLERELFPVLADDFGVVIFPYGSSGAEKVALSVFSEFVSAEYGKSVLSKFMSAFDMQFNSVKYRDYQISRTDFPGLEGVEPAYFAWDKYLVINSSFPALRKMVDASKKVTDNFIQADDFSEMDFGLSDENLFSMYVDADYFISMLRTVLKDENFYSMTGETNQPPRMLGKISLQEFVSNYFVDLIDCFAFIDSVAARVFKKDKRLILNIYTKLNK